MIGQKGTTVQVARIAGIQIEIDYSWLIIFVLVLWSLSAGYFPQQYPGFTWWEYSGVGLIATLLFFVSVLTHEMSHALVANHLGQEVKRITLFIFGGVARLSQEPTDPKSELKIAGVGPLTSFILGGSFLGISRLIGTFEAPQLLVAVFSYLGIINIALAIFNLLPGFPLDGGRLARALFWWRSGDLRAATERASDWGAGIAVGIMVLGALEIFAGALVGGLWLIFIGMFLRGAARAGYRQLLLERALGDVRVSDVMISDPVAINPQLPVGEAVEKFFLKYGRSGFPVATNSHPQGLITLAQVRDVAPERRASVKVEDIMHPLGDDVRIAPDAPISDALRSMVDSDAGQLLVVQDDRMVGVLSRANVMRFVQVRTRLSEYVEEEG